MIFLIFIPGLAKLDIVVFPVRILQSASVVPCLISLEISVY